MNSGDLSVVIGGNKSLQSLDPLDRKCGGFRRLREQEGGGEGGEREEKSVARYN